MRKSPIILITGTPGVGKTTHAEALASSTSLKHLSINEYAKARNCIDGRDTVLNSLIVDEDKLLDALEADEIAATGGYILDWHACDLFPESWIDLVVVLRSSTEVLYDRLTARGYGPEKIEGNIDAEVMQVLLDEARGAFDERVVVELQSDGIEEMDQNVERLKQWVDQWMKDNAEE